MKISKYTLIVSLLWLIPRALLCEYAQVFYCAWPQSHAVSGESRRGFVHYEIGFMSLDKPEVKPFFVGDLYLPNKSEQFEISVATSNLPVFLNFSDIKEINISYTLQNMEYFYDAVPGKEVFKQNVYTKEDSKVKIKTRDGNILNPICADRLRGSPCAGIPTEYLLVKDKYNSNSINIYPRIEITKTEGKGVCRIVFGSKSSNPTGKVETINKYYEIGIKMENLRENPNGKVIVELPSGTKVHAIKKQGNWVYVETTYGIKISGWIWSASLKLSSP